MKTKTKVGWAFLIGFFVMLCIVDCNSKRETQRASQITTVWIPLPATGQPFPATGPRRPYFDVQIINQGRDYVKFRTKDGQVIEQHGEYSSESRPRTPSDQ